MELKEYVWGCIGSGYLPEPRRHRQLGKLLDDTLIHTVVRDQVVEYWTTKQTKVTVRTGKSLHGKSPESGYTFEECTVASDGTPGVIYVINGLLPSDEEVEKMATLNREEE